MYLHRQLPVTTYIYVPGYMCVHVCTQVNGYGPVCDQLAELEQNYLQLARALDTTRHEIPVEGIVKIIEGLKRLQIIIIRTILYSCISMEILNGLLLFLSFSIPIQGKIHLQFSVRNQL